MVMDNTYVELSNTKVYTNSHLFSGNISTLSFIKWKQTWNANELKPLNLMNLRLQMNI